MRPFLNRTRELARLRRAFDAHAPLVTVYGRRRLGKSRLLREAIDHVRSSAPPRGLYFAGDRRESAVQRAALATEIAAVIPGFGAVQYPDWTALLNRLYRDAPDGLVLILDEFTDLVAAAPELPSVLRNQLDISSGRLSIAISGSSQSMMHSLVLDALQPLYGRSTELLKLSAMPIGWMAHALGSPTAVDAVEAWGVVGGVPRYWELFAGRSLWDAIGDHILDPLGALHLEPERLLRDEMADHRRAASILSLVGAGCHRLSEIAGRIGVPAADLSRPVRLLVDVGILSIDVPFGRSQRDTRRTLYTIADPLLRFWFRFVEPNRSRLEDGRRESVETKVRADFCTHLGPVWEDLARTSVPFLDLGAGFDTASAWWGATRAGPVQLDVVARGDDGRLLIGEAKPSVDAREVDRLLWDLEARAGHVDELPTGPRDYRLWVLRGSPEVMAHPRVIGPTAVVSALGGREATAALGWNTRIQQA